MELLTPNGQTNHGAPDSLPEPCHGIVAELERNTGVMYTLRVICSECNGPHGSLMEGEWHFRNGVVYCPTCWNEEAHS